MLKRKCLRDVTTILNQTGQFQTKIPTSQKNNPTLSTISIRVRRTLQTRMKTEIVRAYVHLYQ